MLTAQAAPWYAFELHGRVPARAFKPVPSVDGGILRVVRREVPFVPHAEGRAYQALVKALFTGRGRGIEQILRGVVSRTDARTWLDRSGVDRSALPRDVPPTAWSLLWSIHQSS
jgi:23S rRNA (adenine-N6)-dimethyltransferase